jgi:hypothetical protein
MVWRIRAAKYLNMSPRELDEAEPGLQEWALLMEDAETWAENQRNKG